MQQNGQDQYQPNVQYGGPPIAPSAAPGYPQATGAYPQGGYPQNQAGVGYPGTAYTQQGGYPAQQGGYPAQQGGYPAQQSGAYPQQYGYATQPPAYGYPAQQNLYADQAAPAESAGFMAAPMRDEIPTDKLLTSDVDIKIRNGFVRKVYGILSFQLLITFGMATAFNVYRPAAVWLYENPWVILIAGIVSCFTVCTLVCVPKVARKSPTNYILLGVLAVAMGFVLGFSTGAVDTIGFSIAVGMTAVVTIAVSLFACQTKWDFTGCGVYAFVGLIILMVFGLLTVFFHSRILELVYASLGAALFSFYLIMDTQKIVGGKHRAYQFSIDDYCFAALTLYMDIINLFMYILQIVASSRSD